MPLFSVVIPTYNREELVGSTLASLAAQELDDWELIVVDDGSTDGTLEVVQQFADAHAGRVSILEQDHRGCAAARNRGARQATGEYLAFLDSDDLWFPWTLRTLADQIADNDRPAMVAIALHSFKDESQIAGVEPTLPEVRVGRDFLADALRFGFALGVAHTVCRREAYLRVGGCPELDINGTDSDVLLRMGTEPGFVRVMSPPLLAYRQHDGATTVNPAKGFAGMQLLMQQEREGRYPGGLERQRERWEQILIRVRAVSAMLLRMGEAKRAWQLYRESFLWNVRTRRLRYLIGFPALSLWCRVRGRKGAYDQ